MTDEELFKLLRPHFLMVSGAPEIIMAAQNQNAPKGPYGSIQIRQHIGERGQANIAQRNIPDGKIEMHVMPQRVMTCIAEFFRGNAKLYAERLQQMGKREDVIWHLFRHGISFRNVGAISDLTALQSSNYEQRARVEFVLWMQGSAKYELNTIKQMIVGVQNEKGDVLGSAHVVIE